MSVQRCKRCQKLPRGKIKVANAERYAPYCSFHCQEWHRLELASEWVRNMPGVLKGDKP
jgi:hypothetical protein